MRAQSAKPCMRNQQWPRGMQSPLGNMRGYELAEDINRSLSSQVLLILRCGVRAGPVSLCRKQSCDAPHEWHHRSCQLCSPPRQPWTLLACSGAPITGGSSVHRQR